MDVRIFFQLIKEIRIQKPSVCEYRADTDFPLAKLVDYIQCLF